MRDATGQMYMRNRYYDPQSARFTQEDPIGIAGGLNVYGFAKGDPVSFSDPYGLRAEDDSTKTSQKKSSGQRHDRCEVAGILTNYTSALESNPMDFGDGSYPWKFDFK